MAEERASHEPTAHLMDLWNALAQGLEADAKSDQGAARRLDWLRQTVLEPVKPSSALRSLVWLNQANALFAWQAEAELTRGTPTGASRWQSMAQECSRLNASLTEELNTTHSRFVGPKENKALLLSDLQSFLRRCQEAFEELAGSDAKSAPLRSPTADLENRLASAVEALPLSWPPARLLDLRQRLVAQDLERFAELLPRTLKVLSRSHGDWRAGLSRLAGEWADEAREAVLLVRALLEEMTEARAADTAWTELAVFARALLSPHRLHVELIRDSKQPLQWFEPPTESDVPAAVVERAGLAVRMPPGGWIGFPKGRLVVPIPLAVSPVKEAVDNLNELAAEQPWLELLTLPAGWMKKIDPEHSPDAEEAVTHLVDVLGDIGHSPFVPLGGNAILQRCLEMTRQWAEAAGITILPRAWRYNQHATLDQVAAEVAEVRYIFDRGYPSGVVLELLRFGLQHGDRILRTSAITVSAGPWPEGFGKLWELMSEPQNAFEADLETRLSGWCEAAMKGILDVVAVQYYVDFFSENSDSWRQQHPDRAARFASQFFYFLQHALRLFPFSPVTYQDYPDGWLQRIGARGMVSGRVRRVIRPGLQDDQNQLRVPALVEVE